MDKVSGLSEQVFYNLGLELASQLQSAKITQKRSTIFKDLKHQWHTLIDIYHWVNNRDKSNLPLIPGCDWLLDNFYIIERNYKLFFKHFTPQFDKALIKIEQEKGVFPRLLILARSYLKHSTNLIDEHLLISLLKGFSTSLPLKLAELWALKELLRAAILENLFKIFSELKLKIQSQDLVDQQIQILLAPSTKTLSERNVELIQNFLKDKNLLIKNISYIYRKLHAYPAELAVASKFLDDYLKEINFNYQENLREEQIAQAKRQLEISGAFNSLKEIESLDFKNLLEQVSLTHAICMKDHLYSISNFATRNKVRSAIEALAKKLNMLDYEVVEKVMQFCKVTNSNLFSALFGKQSSELKKSLGIHNPLVELVKRNPLFFYLLPVLLLTSGFVWLVAKIINFQLDTLHILLFFLLVLGSFEFAVQILNNILLRFKGPRFLPGLELDFLPDNLKTAVVLHTLANNEEDIKSSLEWLAFQAYSQSEPNVKWFLLVDVPDSKAPHPVEFIENLAKIGQETCLKLRREYSISIHCLIRNQVFCKSLNQYICWERKRGKLLEFLTLIKEPNRPTTFVNVTSELLKELEDTKIVVTLDSDTFCPPGSILELISFAAHPYNKPKLDDASGKVIEGYVIFQPRVNINFNSFIKTYFSRLISDTQGFDPYTKEVSDLYFDIFGEAIYLGKGALHVDEFYCLLRDRFPEERILSHDLLESIYSRCAFVSQVEFFDDVPSNYFSYTARLHRWIRGDWQLLPWLFNLKESLSALDRWKLFDNLRRSLIPFTLLLGIFLSAAISAKVFTVVLLLSLVIFVFPIFTSFSQAFSLGLRNISFQKRWESFLTDFWKYLTQGLFWISVLPHQVIISLDAILRTLFRLVSKKNLLIWTPFHTLERKQQAGIMFMGLALCQTLAALLLLYLNQSEISITLSCLFFSGTGLVALLNQNYYHKQTQISLENQKYFLGLAFDIWRYFDSYITKERNYLIPDNVQLSPDKRIAERTSPTNIGYSLLAIISAYKLGFLSLLDAVSRLKLILLAADGLDKFFGHLYNWYDTRNGKVLAPRYVSFVDSGNFISSLVVVKSFAEKALELPLFDERSKFFIKECLGVDLADLLSEKSLKLGKFDGFSSYFRSKGKEFGDIFKPVNSNLSEDQLGILKKELNLISALCEKLITEPDFKLLYDEKRKLFCIGYNIDSAKPDSGLYDFLASEARLSYYTVLSIHKFDLKSWFKLSRIHSYLFNQFVMLSWSGTMFEYLMPDLFLKTFSETIVGNSILSCIRIHQSFAKSHGIPWGISESAYSMVDFMANYQYKAFGVPGLGLKRGLEYELVVSPYSTIMAAQYVPLEAYKNLKTIETNFSGRGEFGFFESIDFSSDRLARTERFFVCDSFFAHHQGMSICALTNLLCEDFIKNLYHSDLRIKGCESLLFERYPKLTETVSIEELSYTPRKVTADSGEPPLATFTTPVSVAPRTHFISNGELVEVVDTSGESFLYCPKFDIFLTRWREDAVSPSGRYYIYFKDSDSTKVASVGFSPTKIKGDLYEVFVSPDKFEIKHRINNLFVYLEATIAVDMPCEIRKVTFVNLSPKTKQVDFASFGEVCLNKLTADLAHPAFYKLFITSEILKDQDTALLHRRPRSRKEPGISLAHKLVIPKVFKPTDFETSREKFLGRGGDYALPAAFKQEKFSGSEGVVLDPIFSIKQSIILSPGQSESVYFLTLVGKDREEALEMLSQFQDTNTLQRAFELAWSQNNIELRTEHFHSNNFLTYQRLANLVFYGHTGFNGSPPVTIKSAQRELWRLGLSGDYPIILMILRSSTDITFAEELIEAYAYLRFKSIPCDLVILNLITEGYIQEIKDKLEYLIRFKVGPDCFDSPKGVFLRMASSLTDKDIQNLKLVARIVFENPVKNLSETLRDLLSRERTVLNFEQQIPRIPSQEFDLIELEKIAYYTSPASGFMEDGRFIQFVKPDSLPPRPWVHTLANKDVGALLSERGSFCSWAFNSREFKITPWSNDFVEDPIYEALFIRDPKSGAVATNNLLISEPQSTMCVIYDFDQVIYERRFTGLSVTTKVYLCDRGIVSEFFISDLNYDFYFYCEPVLGVNKEETYRFLRFNYIPEANCITIWNCYSEDFGDKVVVIWSTAPVEAFTTSKNEFVGAIHSLSSPYIFKNKDQVSLSGKLVEGEPCCVVLKVKPTMKNFKIIKFAISQEGLEPFIESLKSGSINSSPVSDFKDNVAGRFSVQTPSKSFDLSVNHWLLYQTYVCRMLGRTAFYQSGGAFGYRDQLQDSLAFLLINPEICKKQIILHANRQFLEGDVQHWWHPPSGKGTRTLFSDDFLWLPFAVINYVKSTGDYSILRETAQFLTGPLLKEHEHEIYIYPNVTDISDTIYEHCKRAIIRGFRYGRHGLPLIGIGDWNDGFSEVGILGEGESVWLAWFQAYIFKEFASIADYFGDSEFANQLKLKSDKLVEAVETYAWDGDWYIRAFFDNGDPLGSKKCKEAKIDSLAQSWAVITGLGLKERQEKAISACVENLVDYEARIIKLLTPPFDKSDPSPGYIQGYLPGIRENGAQYTHAAVWLIMAAAMLGKKELAYSLFQSINPIETYLSIPGTIDFYCTEPYVLCGDVYSHPQVKGKGGWSWYTGSSGWLYQVAVRWILGISLQNGRIYLLKTFPDGWKEFKFQLFKAIFEVKNEGDHLKIFKNEKEVQNGIPISELFEEKRFLVLWSREK